MNYELEFHRDQSRCIFCRESCRPVSSRAATPSGGAFKGEAFGRNLGRLTFGTFLKQFLKHFFGAYLK